MNQTNKLETEEINWQRRDLKTKIPFKEILIWASLCILMLVPAMGDPMLKIEQVGRLKVLRFTRFFVEMWIVHNLRRVILELPPHTLKLLHCALTKKKVVRLTFLFSAIWYILHFWNIQKSGRIFPPKMFTEQSYFHGD